MKWLPFCVLCMENLTHVMKVMGSIPFRHFFFTQFNFVPYKCYLSSKDQLTEGPKLLKKKGTKCLGCKIELPTNYKRCGRLLMSLRVFMSM